MNRRADDQRSSITRILALVFLAMEIQTGTLAKAGWAIAQLTNNNTDDLWRAVSGTNVAWYDWDGSRWAVNSNFAGKFANTNITGLAFLGEAWGPATSGTGVVWVVVETQDLTNGETITESMQAIGEDSGGKALQS